MMKNLASASGWSCLRTAGDGLRQSSSGHALLLTTCIYWGRLSHEGRRFEDWPEEGASAAVQ
jgi:hypothetical protein